MPYTLNNEDTPNGLHITRLVASGRIADEEAGRLMKELSQSFSGLPMLCIATDDLEVTAEARRVFTTRVGNDAAVPSAIVTHSVVMRVTVNFIGRVNGNNNTRLFGGEAEALKWLEETCLKKAAP
jgi:hypothetical protein